MKLFLDVKRKLASLFSPKVLLTTLGIGLLPAFASADEASVSLKFTSGDLIYLYISIGLGVVALIFAWFFASGVRKESPGSEAMQSVGKAIKEGALAYLRQQIRTMLIFVLILAIALAFLFHNQYNSWSLGLWTAACFCGGVAASYIAGYTGMIMAVDGNMRTANAALTSYSKTLRIAFRSGAVAGMVTVGMGLIGASLIFIFAQADAMKLLVGFGFGGSLAALFMRVGGGIFTKAADVGADLVGKVEAGIPEDDPRNPATIADNVGDNVGDCAGMAADIFESYEVTLVAAIILGAATASIFDQSTWMKLILFALMARGVGIIASIFGIFAVRGSDDINSDPLFSIRKGFWLSAAIAILGTAGLAWYLMGGRDQHLRTTQLDNFEGKQRAEFQTLHDVLQEYMSKSTAATAQAQVQAFAKDPRAVASGLGPVALSSPQLDQNLLGFDQKTLAPVDSDTSNFQPVDFNNPNDKVLSYTVVPQPTGPGGQPTPINFRDYFAAKGPDGKYTQKPFIVASVKVPLQAPPPPGVKNPPPSPQEMDSIFMGPITEDDLTTQLKTNPKAQEIKTGNVPVTIYERPTDGAVAIGFDVPDGAKPMQYQVRPPQIFNNSISDVNNVRTGKSLVTLKAVDMLRLDQTHVEVPWYMFFLAITFGVLMAFAIELLTDYYVSTHKRPVQEVAGVATAGPAPMIIQGFALAAESSVFSVLVIVIALIMPLVFFPPSMYGGSYLLSFYGIALVGLGLLTTTGFILAMDTFGPISDNAQGVFEMSGAGHESASGSKAVQRLDAAGNTTKALTKGFAIATAVVAAVALFQSYLQTAHLEVIGIRLDIPEIFLGLLIGGAAPYLFAAFSINAVGRASFQLIEEVRRQFRDDPGIMAGTSKPNYGRCVAIVTEAAQKELLGPGILAICLPIAVAFGFSIGKPSTMIGGQPYNLTGAEALGGFLAGAILSGQLMAVLLANSGGMWDNAKKLIEDGLYGGKGTDAHKAGVVCDTVGDPFKDTAGPAMNPLIKVMNLVAILLAAIVIKPWSNTILMVVTLAAVALLAFSVWWSKRASFSAALAGAQDSATHTPLAYDDPEPVETIHMDAAAVSTSPEVSSRRLTVDDEPEPVKVDSHGGEAHEPAEEDEAENKEE